MIFQNSIKNFYLKNLKIGMNLKLLNNLLFIFLIIILILLLKKRKHIKKNNYIGGKN